jgi:predicted transcriptional regulator
MRALDVMTSEVISVAPDTSVQALAALPLGAWDQRGARRMPTIG